MKKPSLPLAPDPAVATGNGAMDRRTMLLIACASCVAACSPPPPPDGGDVTGTDAADDQVRVDVADITDVPGDAVSDVAPGCDLADVGPVSDYPVGTRRAVMPMLDGQTVPLIVGRDAMGLYAVSARCRHFQGLVEPRDDGDGGGPYLLCTQVPMSAHGSTFDDDGRVLSGPSLDPRYGNLPNFQVNLCGDRVIVNVYMVVPIGTRTAVA